MALAICEAKYDVAGLGILFWLEGLVEAHPVLEAVDHVLGFGHFLYSWEVQNGATGTILELLQLHDIAVHFGESDHGAVLAAGELLHLYDVPLLVLGQGELPGGDLGPRHGRLLPHEPRHHGDGRRLARPRRRRAAAVNRLQRGVDQAPQSGEWHLLFQM